VIGCYAQTELGHGSNVADLETTATLDMGTNEWIFHTPTITAYKFWPGAMGMIGNHAVVQARCISLGKDYGVKPFFV
jgi:acyl-CoA oxidase